VGWDLVEPLLRGHWAELSGSARLLLARMALSALDDGQPPRYFGGHEELAQTLDGQLHDVGPKRDAQLRRVRRLLDQLRQAGAIEIAKTAHLGHRAEYTLKIRRALQGRNSPTGLQGRNSPTTPNPVGQKRSIMQGRNSPTKEQGGTIARANATRASEPTCTICSRREAECRRVAAKTEDAHQFTPKSRAGAA
jgi:hypothetical protein